MMPKLKGNKEFLLYFYKCAPFYFSGTKCKVDRGESATVKASKLKPIGNEQRGNLDSYTSSGGDKMWKRLACGEANDRFITEESQQK